MYESHFQFSSRPFSAAPLTESYFPAENIEGSRQTLARTIDRAEGIGLAVGPAGVGKSLLCRLLASEFQESFNVAMLSSARVVTRKSLLQNILFELGLEYRGLEEGELRLSLLDFLQPNEHCPNGMLLIVDEAHTLGLRLLEEIRMITNLVRDGQPRVRLVLAGGAKLEERFTSPKLASFNQRITARCYLHGFRRDETAEYVRTRLSAAGSSRDAVFTEDALCATHQASDGIPRLVNQVCDHALVMAFAGGKHAIDAAGIQEAWADLQQLPGPWQETSPSSSEGAVVEFGELGDELDEPTTCGSHPDALVEFDNSERSVSSLATEECTPFLPEKIPSTEESEEAAELTVQDSTTTEQPTASASDLEQARDPFGEAFDEEVVVVARSTVRESALTSRPRVHSVEGQVLATALECVEPRCLTVEAEAEQPAIDEAACEEIVISDSGESSPVETVKVGDEASEMFEYTVFEANNTADLALQALCDINIAMVKLESNEEPESLTVKFSDHRDSLGDDSSIIVVEPNEPTAEATSLACRAADHQMGYQDLFAQLRHG